MRELMEVQAVRDAVELAEVRFGYGAAPVLDGVNLRLRSGQIAVLAGANGSGKSTLLRLLVGLLRPDAGIVRVLGGSPVDPAIRRRIGYAPQGLRTVTSLPVSVAEVVAAGITPSKGVFARMGRSDWRRVQASIEAVGLEGLSRECLFELSGGQQQRAIIARALVGDPDLLLLDEPTTGIDPRSRPIVVREFRRRAEAGATVIAVSHDPDEFHEVCDRILVLESGRLEPVTHDEFHHRFHQHAGPT
ncbi:MAG TPA: metal ABC transporter ATP-binding protein [Actinomycetota bacterium]|nr:metal ABC transporter ATP-binding protein [Actinomycetota bacterium]